MDYKCVVINLPAVLFHFGERVATPTVAPHKIMGHPAWRRYVTGVATLDATLQQIAGSFNRATHEVADTINAMCAGADLDNEVLTYLEQARQAGRKLYGIITTTKREFDAMLQRHPFDISLFDKLFYLSECPGGYLTPEVFSYIADAVQHRPPEIVYIDRKLEPVNICSAAGMLPLYLNRDNRYLRLIMPKEQVIAALDSFLYSEFPHTYNQTVTKDEGTREHKGAVAESYTALWIWSLFPGILPDTVKGKLQQLGNGLHRIHFFDDRKEVERYYNLPFDIDTLSIYASVMYEHNRMPAAAAAGILNEILNNVNDSGLLRVYFDENRPRIDPVPILNSIYLAYLLNRENDPVVRQNERFIVRILANGGWEYGTFYFVSPTIFLLAVFRVARRFMDRVPEDIREGLKAALRRKMGTAATPLELGIRLLISRWLDIPNPEDMRSLLMQRADVPGFQWQPAPLYKAPSLELDYFNPLFDAAVIKAALEGYHHIPADQDAITTSLWNIQP